MIFTIECPLCGEEMQLEAEGEELAEIEADAGALIACEECKIDTEYSLENGELLAIVDDEEDSDELAEDLEPEEDDQDDEPEE